jgi:hypothetical protein
MKTILATIAALAALLGVTSGAADARPIHHTAQVKAPNHEVDKRRVTAVKFVQIEGTVAVRFKMNDGSAWLSPDRSCMGPRRHACEVAWQR